MFLVHISLESSSTIFTLIYSLFYLPLPLVSSHWSCVIINKLNTCVLFSKYVNIYKDGYIHEWIRIFMNEIDKCKLSNLIVFWLKYCYNPVSQLIVIPFPKWGICQCLFTICSMIQILSHLHYIDTLINNPICIHIAEARNCSSYVRMIYVKIS
jgi:hypothetical protein